MAYLSPSSSPPLERLLFPPSYTVFGTSEARGKSPLIVTITTTNITIDIAININVVHSTIDY